MPAKKIIDAVMSTLAVIGSSIATATAGPMPGSTPTGVPSTQPKKHPGGCETDGACEKPVRSELRMSMSEPARRSEAGQVDRQELGEHPVDGGGDRQPCDRIDQICAHAQALLQFRTAQPLHRQHVAQRAAQDEATGRDQ